jgi:hypothetical protein
MKNFELNEDQSKDYIMKNKAAKTLNLLNLVDKIFPEMLFMLDSGFNLLIHGYGSKQYLVNFFV